MARRAWWPLALPDQYGLMMNVKGKIGGHQADLGLTNAQVARIDSICQTFMAVYDYVEASRETAGSLAEWRDNIFYTKDIEDGVPSPPAFSTFTAPGGAFRGIITEFKATRDMIITLPGYTEAIGDDLMFIGPEQSSVIPESVTPTLKVIPAATGYLASIVISNRQQSDAWEVWILNKGASEWSRLGQFTGKSVDITFTPPVEGEPYLFQLRVQLRKNNTNYGQPSQAATVTVNPLIGSTLLVDGGGQLDLRSIGRREDEAAEFVPDRLGVGEAVVSKVLWHRGLHSVDAVAATHADADHTQGLTDVLKNFAAGALWIGPGVEYEPEIAELAAIAAKRGIPIVILHRGIRFAAAGAEIEVLHPAEDSAARNNDNSIVLRISYGGRAFLLTGDIERGGESALIANALGTADVVKMPHHGSRTSSTDEFVSAVNAGYAVVSAGRRSRFGHPHPEVVETWLAAGAEILSTQDRGMITFRTDGEGLWVESYR